MDASVQEEQGNQLPINFNYIILAVILIVLLAGYLYFSGFLTKKSNEISKEQQAKIEAKMVAESPIHIGKVRVAPGENINVYIDEPLPKHAEVLALYSETAKSNFSAVALEGCVTTKKVAKQLGCLFTMPTKEGKYYFNLLDKNGKFIMRSNDIIIGVTK
jgi:hypothetical protein